MTINLTDAELHLQQKTQAAKDAVQQYVNQYASANATEDLMRTIKVEVIQYQGQDETIIRDGNTNSILSHQQMLDKFAKERPGYLNSIQKMEKK